MPDDGGDPRSYAIIGAAMEAYRVLGTGFLESIYHQALTIAFGLRGNPFEREVPLCVYYKAQMLASTFRADLLYLGAIIVELKASKRLGAADEAQILHYVKAAQRELGLLLNFGAERLEIRRFIGAPNTQDSSGALER